MLYVQEVSITNIMWAPEKGSYILIYFLICECLTLNVSVRADASLVLVSPEGFLAAVDPPGGIWGPCYVLEQLGSFVWSQQAGPRAVRTHGLVLAAEPQLSPGSRTLEQLGALALLM